MCPLPPLCLKRHWAEPQPSAAAAHQHRRPRWGLLLLVQHRAAGPPAGTWHSRETGNAQITPSAARIDHSPPRQPSCRSAPLAHSLTHTRTLARPRLWRRPLEAQAQRSKRLQNAGQMADRPRARPPTPPGGRGSHGQSSQGRPAPPAAHAPSTAACDGVPLRPQLALQPRHVRARARGKGLAVHRTAQGTQSHHQPPPQLPNPSAALALTAPTRAHQAPAWNQSARFPQ
jgi:hypothetical protein